MEKRPTLYVPDHSKLYYISIIVAIAAVIIRLLLNFIFFGSADPAFAGYSGSLLFAEPNRSTGWLIASGIVQLLASASIPLGYFLAKKKLWFAQLGFLMLLVYNIVCYIPVLMQMSFILDMMSMLDPKVNAEAILLNILLMILIIFIFILLLAVMLIRVFGAIPGVILYNLAAKGRLRNNKPIIIATAIGWGVMMLMDLSLSMEMNDTLSDYATDRISDVYLLLNCLPYLINLAAAILFGLSLERPFIEPKPKRTAPQPVYTQPVYMQPVNCQPAVMQQPVVMPQPVFVQPTAAPQQPVYMQFANGQQPVYIVQQPMQPVIMPQPVFVQPANAQQPFTQTPAPQQVQPAPTAVPQTDSTPAAAPQTDTAPITESATSDMIQ